MEFRVKPIPNNFSGISTSWWWKVPAESNQKITHRSHHPVYVEYSLFIWLSIYLVTFIFFYYSVPTFPSIFLSWFFSNLFGSLSSHTSRLRNLRFKPCLFKDGRIGRDFIHFLRVGYLDSIDSGDPRVRRNPKFSAASWDDKDTGDGHYHKDPMRVGGSQETSRDFPLENNIRKQWAKDPFSQSVLFQLFFLWLIFFIYCL